MILNVSEIEAVPMETDEVIVTTARMVQLKAVRFQKTLDIVKCPVQ